MHNGDDIRRKHALAADHLKHAVECREGHAHAFELFHSLSTSGDLIMDNRIDKLSTMKQD